MVISYRSFGTNYRFHLQGSRIQEALNSLLLKLVPIFCPETSVGKYRFLLRNSLDERSTEGEDWFEPALNKPTSFYVLLTVHLGIIIFK